MLSQISCYFYLNILQYISELVCSDFLVQLRTGVWRCNSRYYKLLVSPRFKKTHYQQDKIFNSAKLRKVKQKTLVFYWEFSAILTFQIKYAYFEANLIILNKNILNQLARLPRQSRMNFRGKTDKGSTLSVQCEDVGCVKERKENI